MGRFSLRGRSAALAALAGLTLAVATLPAAADDAADFFKGKTVRIVVGYTPGGGYDAHARMLAPHLASQIGANVIVENKPGAGGLAALNALVRDPPDGLRIMLLNGEGAALAQIVDLPGMRFDLAQIGVLGRVSYENRVLLAAANSPFRQIGAFLKAKDTLAFGSGGRIDGMGDMASIFCRALKLPCKLITGYPGSKDVTLALMRGELHAQVTSESQTATLVQGKEIVAVAVLAPNRAPMLPSTPTIFEVAQLSPEQAKWIRFRAGISDIGRTLVVPPNVPAGRSAVLENAFRAILTDPAIIADAKRTNRPVDYASAEDVRKVIRATFAGLKPEERAEIKQLILHGY